MNRFMVGATLAIAAAACHTHASAGAGNPAPTGADTLRGTFVLEGADPMTTAVLRTADGRVVLDGVPPSMRLLAHLDLWVRGAPAETGAGGGGGGSFRVSEFRVRGADGQPAWDGVVRAQDGGLALELLDDHSLHALRGTPADFARLVGSRVWVTETTAHTVAAFGVIQ